MEDTPIDAPAGIALLGAEMLTWSDFEGSIGGVRGRTATALLHGFEGARSRALVAGPHTAAVVREVAAQFESTDVLVRSLIDATTLREELPAGVTVHCGPLDRLHPEARYDAVIALDGLDRLHSAEEEQPPWSTTLEQLTDLLDDAGEMYLGAGNEAGADRLLTLGPQQRHDDAHWPNARSTGANVPVDELTAHLDSQHHLSRIEAWACHGSRTEPLLAAPASVFRTFRRDGRFAALVSRAAQDGVEGLVPVKSVGLSARTLLRHGLGAETAPLWVLHFRAGVPPTEAREPVILVADPEGGQSPGVGVRITPGAGPWAREVLPPTEVHRCAPEVERDPARLSAPILAGELLSLRFADLCAAMDRAEIGNLVRRYRDWLAEDASSGQVDPAKVPVTFDGVMDTDTGLVPFDPSLRATVEATVEDVLARVLLVAGRAALSGGQRHPWPVSYTPRQVADELLAAADVRFLDEAWQRVDELHRALSADAGADPFSAGASPLGYAEAMSLLAQHRARADELEAQVEWLVVNIHQRQRGVRALRIKVRELENSREFRTGRRIHWARHKASRAKQKLQARREQRWGTETPALGEWRPPSGEEREPIPVDQELLPPGYTPKGPTV